MICIMFLSLTSAEQIELDDFEIIVNDTWFVNEKTSIEIVTRNINNQTVDVENILFDVSDLNDTEVTNFSLVRLNTGNYEKQFLALNSTVLNINITVQDGPKSMSKNISIVVRDQTLKEQITARSFQENWRKVLFDTYFYTRDNWEYVLLSGLFIIIFLVFIIILEVAGRKKDVRN